MWTTVTQVSPDTVDITYSGFLLGLIGLGIVALLGWAGYLLVRYRKWQWALVISIIPVIIGSIVLPSMAGERITITPTTIRHTKGFLASPGFREIDLTSLRQVKLETVVTTRRKKGRDRKTRSLSLAMTNKSGVTTHYKTGNLWASHVDRTVEAMKKAGIEVLDER